MTTPLTWALRRASGPVDEILGDAGPRARRSLAVAVLLGLAQTATVIVQAVLLATVISGALRGRADLAQLAPQLIGLGAAIAARGVFAWGAEAIAQRVSSSVAGTVRRGLLAHALALGPTWLAGERAGELSLTATRGADSIGSYVGRYLPQLVVAGLAPVAVLAWVAYTDWISLLVLVVLLALVPPAMVFFGRRATESTTRQWRRLASLSAHLLELIEGLPTLRAFGRVEYGRREVAEATEGLRRSTIRALRVAFLSSLALELLAGLGTGLVAMVLGLRLLDGHSSLYVALAVLLVSPEVFLPLRRASAEFHTSAEGRNAGERVAATLARAPRQSPGAGLIAPEVASAPLQFDSVSVEFEDRAQPAIERLSFTVEHGGRVALVGPSGSGKSTALHAVLGLVPVASGRILIGTSDLATLDLAQWRRQVAWVPQRPHLFAGSIAENLRLADPEADESVLQRAASKAGLDGVLRGLPHGLDTPIGDGGVALSAGERQRVAIARAVLHGGRIVLLDEVGAHLDPAARLSLRGTLEPWLEGRTVIVAAHHLDVVTGLDDVVALGDAARADLHAGRDR
ncbi:MAG: thiol reductant ABC exporter subunit CydD [Acidimicrobiales bacterium]